MTNLPLMKIKDLLGPEMRYHYPDAEMFIRDGRLYVRVKDRVVEIMGGSGDLHVASDRLRQVLR